MTNKEKAQITYKILQKRRIKRIKEEEKQYRQLKLSSMDKMYRKSRITNKRIGQP